MTFGTFGTFASEWKPRVALSSLNLSELKKNISICDVEVLWGHKRTNCEWGCVRVSRGRKVISERLLFLNFWLIPIYLYRSARKSVILYDKQLNIFKAIKVPLHALFRPDTAVYWSTHLIVPVVVKNGTATNGIFMNASLPPCLRHKIVSGSWSWLQASWSCQTRYLASIRQQ